MNRFCVPEEEPGSEAAHDPVSGGETHGFRKVVPEPSTVLLLSTGFVGVLGIGVRRRRRTERQKGRDGSGSARQHKSGLILFFMDAKTARAGRVSLVGAASRLGSAPLSQRRLPREIRDERAGVPGLRDT